MNLGMKDSRGCESGIGWYLKIHSLLSTGLAFLIWLLSANGVGVFAWFVLVEVGSSRS